MLIRQNRSVASHEPRWAKWGLLTLVVYSASLKKYSDEWIHEGPPFVPPLEAVIQYGRPITILLFVVLLFFMATQGNFTRCIQTTKPVAWLLVTQGVIVFKLLSSGDLDFALQLSAVLIVLCLVMLFGLKSWLIKSSDIDACIAAIAAVGALFILLTSIQAEISASAIFVANDRLNGTTGNAQHAAALLGAAAPAMFYMAIRHASWVRFIWLGLLAAAGCCIYMTGSRTGLAMFILGLGVVGNASGLRRMIIPTVAVITLSYLSFWAFGTEVVNT